MAQQPRHRYYFSFVPNLRNTHLQILTIRKLAMAELPPLISPRILLPSGVPPEAYIIHENPIFLGEERVHPQQVHDAIGLRGYSALGSISLPGAATRKEFTFFVMQAEAENGRPPALIGRQMDEIIWGDVATLRPARPPVGSITLCSARVIELLMYGRNMDRDALSNVRYDGGFAHRGLSGSDVRFPLVPENSVIIGSAKGAGFARTIGGHEGIDLHHVTVTALGHGALVQNHSSQGILLGV
jgi:hypothetical protein